jgi:hypothetical protein
MSKLKACLFLPLLLSLLGCATGKPGRLSLLSPGVRNGAQAPRSIGGGWLALCQTGDTHWTLQPTSVRSRRVHDDQLDQPGEQSGREFRPNKEGALCLLRHGSLRAGRVMPAEFKTARPSEVNLLNSMGFGVPALFSIDTYLLRAGDVENNPARYTLSVSVNSGPPQTLGEFERGIEPAFESVVLFWAGDLNQDGVADFIFEHKSFHQRAQSLYLSSKNGGGYQQAGLDLWTGSE